MTIPRSLALRAGAFLLLSATLGCQSYRALEVGDVRQGDRLRLTLAEPVPLRLQELTIERATLVDAEAVAVREGDLVLSALWVERQDGIGVPGDGWTVSVPVASVATLEERRFSLWRSAVVAAGVLVATALGWDAVGGGGSGEGSGDGGGQTR